MKTSYVLAGGVCLLALTVGVVSTVPMSDIVPVAAKKDAAPAVLQEQFGADQPPAQQAQSVLPSAPAASLAQQDAASYAAAPAMKAEAKTAMGEAAANRAVAQQEMLVGAAAPAFAPAPVPEPSMMRAKEHRDTFESVKENAVKLVKEAPVSTFSVDVDTASYSFVRAALNGNHLPPKDAVRIEEMVNYFPYAYEAPKDKATPFKVNVSVVPSPWNKGTKLMHIGIKGYQLQTAEKPHTNLVFLLDISGSMEEPNKLPLLKNSLKLLLDSLKPDDTIAIVTYAGNAGTALEPTPAKEKAKIIAALDNLNAGGSTAGAEGIRQAYALAESNFDKAGINRVILATDGDFNVGITNPEELKDFVERKRESGVFLSVLGFGQGNYNDAMMQTLAQNGNGNAAYIDTLNEARKVLLDEAGSTLFPIAKDVKIQVEFNPSQVAEYRLIGYETRMLNREDFNNDKVDAGDIGAGHTVTAVYEITPVGSDAKLVDDSRYADSKPQANTSKSDEYAFVKIRYKEPAGSTSKLITTPVTAAQESTELAKAPSEARFAIAVAGAAQLLRGDSGIKQFSYDDAIALAQSAKGEDEFGYRAEFINLLRIAKSAAAMQPNGQGQ